MDGKADHKDVDEWTLEEIQGMLTRAEVLSQAGSSTLMGWNSTGAKLFKYKNFPQAQKLAITGGRNNQNLQPCFRCGKLNPILPGEKYKCFCKEKPTCGIDGCKGNHLAKFHKTAIERRQQFLQKNMQNGVQYPSQQGINSIENKDILERNDEEQQLDENLALVWEVSSSDEWMGIEIKLAHLFTGALLDCGAQFCVVSGKFYDEHLKHLGVETLANKCEAKAVNGEKLTTRFQVPLTLQIGSELLEVQFRVIENINTPII